MCGGDQIDIMSAFFLQFQKNFSQTFFTDLHSHLCIGNPIVLAVYTTKRTAGKKHSPGSSLPGNTGFFPEMKRCPGCQYVFSGYSADSGFSIFPIRTAFSRAQVTFFHKIPLSQIKKEPLLRQIIHLPLQQPHLSWHFTTTNIIIICKEVRSSCKHGNQRPLCPFRMHSMLPDGRSSLPERCACKPEFSA